LENLSKNNSFTLINLQQMSANILTQIVSTFYFLPALIPNPQKIKRAFNPPYGFLPNSVQDKSPFHRDPRRRASDNSTLAIGGVSSPLDSFVVAESSVLRTNFSAGKPAHRQSAKRYG
jgi:hypothetical protein